MTRVLVAGANGFIGRNIGTFLGERLDLDALIRDERGVAGYQRHHSIGSLADLNLRGYDAVINAAGHAHRERDSLEEHFIANRDFAEHLARMAVEANVRIFIHLGSISVYGSAEKITPISQENPETPYAISKLEGDRTLRNIFSSGNTSSVILRLPSTYGPHAKGNPLKFLEWASQRKWLPLSGADKKRSFVYVGNLCDAIAAAISQLKDSGKNTLCTPFSDGGEFSPRELYEALCLEYNGKTEPSYRLKEAIWIGAKIGDVLESLGLPSPISSTKYYRMFCQAVVTTEAFSSVFSWKPPYSKEGGIKKMAEWHKSENRRNRSHA